MTKSKGRPPPDDGRPDPLERLGALTARGLDIGHIPGGPPGSSFEILAGALGSMHHQRSADLLQAKFMQDARAVQSAKSRWFMDVCDRAIAEDWRERGKGNRNGAHYSNGTIHRLAEYTYIEWLSAERCTWCKGSGLQQNGTRGCGACGGIGLARQSGRGDADAILLSESGYRTSKWPARMLWCRSELRRQEIEARARFYDALRGFRAPA
jgi:hypothetical protein